MVKPVVEFVVKFVVLMVEPIVDLVRNDNVCIVHRYYIIKNLDVSISGCVFSEL